MFRQKYLAMNFTGHVPVFAQTVPGTDFLCLSFPGQEHTYTHLHQMTARYTPQVLQLSLLKYFTSVLHGGLVWLVCGFWLVLFENTNLIGLSFGGFFLFLIYQEQKSHISVLHCH